jgi:hypothetical protein
VNLVFVHADDSNSWNSAQWRSVIPAAAFNRTRRHRAQVVGIQDFATHPQLAEYYCADADVIVLQRGAMPNSWAAVESWRQRGKVILADIDDGYPQIPQGHPAWPFWFQGITRGPDGQPQQMPRPGIYDMADGLKKVHGLTSPNRLILEDWSKQVGVKTAFVPNYPDLTIYNVKRTRSPVDDGTVWVAWGGSAGHLQSFADSGILYALARVLSVRPHTRLVYCGSDLRAFNAIALKEHQKLHFNWRSYKSWPKLLANFDIGLIPAAGEFDARRSWIKPMEYSLVNIPWIASKTQAYAGLEDYGVFVDNTPDAWAAALVEMLDHGGNETQIRRARKWAVSLDIDEHVDEMAKTYGSFT